MPSFRSSPRFIASAAAIAATLSASTVAIAQTPPPKHCVAVARDPDEAARSLAVRIERTLATSPSVRVVADDRTRAALRGESVDDPALVNIVAARRSLVSTDADAASLATIADALGCAVITVVSSTPRGFSLRRFAVIERTFDAATEQPQWSDDALNTRLALPAPPPNNAANSGSNASSTVVPSANSQPVRAQPAAQPRAMPTTRADPRVTTPDPTRQSNTTRSTPVWAWVIAGVAGAALVGGFIAAQTIGPSVPLVHVSGPGTAP